MFFLLLGLFAHVDLHLRLHLRLCVLRGYSVKILPYTQDFQVSSCLWPVLSLLRHVQKCAKQALENILRDMHLIKAIRSVEDLPVRQIPKNRLRFPYPQERLRCLFFFPDEGHSSQSSNNILISVPLLLHGGPLFSTSPLNIYPCFLHGSSGSGHLRCPMYMVFEDPSIGSCRDVVSRNVCGTPGLRHIRN